MKQMSVLTAMLALIGSSTPARAQQNLDTLAYARVATAMHAQGSDSSRVVASVPRAALVRLNGCAAGWCNIARPGATGYVPESTLTVTSTVSGKGYTNSRGEWVPSPTRTPGNAVPSGASAQCRDGTYSFSRSRRGTCSHHGGVARWI